MTQRELPARRSALGPEPPIVARCMVEVRSDGSLSVARGVFELEDDVVVLEGRGRTPLELLSVIARGAIAQARDRLTGTLRNVEQRLLRG